MMRALLLTLTLFLFAGVRTTATVRPAAGSMDATGAGFAGHV